MWEEKLALSRKLFLVNGMLPMVCHNSSKVIYMATGFLVKSCFLGSFLFMMIMNNMRHFYANYLNVHHLISTWTSSFKKAPKAIFRNLFYDPCRKQVKKITTCHHNSHCESQ